MNSLGLARVVTVSFSMIFRLVRAAPVGQSLVTQASPYLDPVFHILDEGDEIEGEEGEVLVRAIVSVMLVLLGGVFAGLTIGLMGQDEVYLQVTAETGEAEERRCATKVLKLLSKGKHWVLVTLLLSNVITNETLPIVLDRLLGGGWPAIVSSTAAIVVFGEIIPQSICVRYGLPLGAYFAPFVKVLMYLMYPVAWPIAKLLDYMLGEDHGTIYKKAGLKSLVTLHHHMGIERLNEDEVTIISAVLDLKDKPVSKIMTPIDDVFVLSSDTILDEAMVEEILLTGFNRIPIHFPNEPLNFCGMLLVRTLITYDPDDALPISAFALATLPETSPDTSCLNILNYFQEGKSHMVAVSTQPGAVTGAVGVLTLEDVIEELIGEEIVDESDVYVDVHRAIRRVTPSPLLSRKQKKQNLERVSDATKSSTGGENSGDAGTNGAGHKDVITNQKIATLRPSNKASDPKYTHNTKITIKRGPHPNQHLSQDRIDASSVGSSDMRNGVKPASSATSALSPGSHMGGTPLRPKASRQEVLDKTDSAYLTTSLVNLNDEESRNLDHADNDPTDEGSLAELARSPGNVVIKNPSEIEVLNTESDALQRNLGTKKINKLGKQEPSSSKGDQSSDDDEARMTFSENVVRVNGINKVVISEISSEDSASSGDESSSQDSKLTRRRRDKIARE